VDRPRTRAIDPRRPILLLLFRRFFIVGNVIRLPQIVKLALAALRRPLLLGGQELFNGPPRHGVINFVHGGDVYPCTGECNPSDLTWESGGGGREESETNGRHTWREG
jgi:hypothetical protein